MKTSIKQYENYSHSPIHEMAVRAIHELTEAGVNHPRNSFPAWNDAALVAFTDDDDPTPIGFMIYRYNFEQCSWWILMAYVVKKYRRKGIHTKLFETLVERAQKRGDILSIECGTHPDNKAAQAAFAKQGRKVATIGYRYDIAQFAHGNPALVIDRGKG